MSEDKVTGACLCGAVAYEAAGPFKAFQYCHCSRCRRFTGAAHGCNLFCPPPQFQWTRGEEHVGRFALPEAKYFATAFCKICGSSLPWTNQAGTMIMIPAGGLHQAPSLPVERSIHWASRAPWYVQPSEIPCFDEVPPRRS